MARKLFDERDMLAEVLSNAQSPKKTRKSKLKLPFKHIAIGLGICVVIGLVGGGIYLIARGGSKDPALAALASYQQETPFTVYAPKKLPNGYSIDQESMSFSNGIVFTTLKSNDADKPSVTMSQQAAPAGISVETLYGGTGQPETFDVPAGKLYVGGTAKTTNSTLVTPSSWILFSAPNTINGEFIKSLAADLTPIK